MWSSHGLESHVHSHVICRVRTTSRRSSRTASLMFFVSYKLSLQKFCN